MKTKPLISPESRENVGHIKASGSQVVGPYSVHPNGRLYLIEDALPFASVTEQAIHETLGPFIVQRAKREIRVEKDYTAELDFPILRIPGIRDGLQIHPVHGSKSNQKNLNVNAATNEWYCHACQSGGTSLHWLAVEQKIIGCWETSRGGLRGGKFLEAKNRVIQLGLLQDPGTAAIDAVDKATRGQKPQKNTRGEDETALPLLEMAGLPDWEADGRIAVLIRLDKDRDGERLTTVYRVLVDENGQFRGEPLGQSRFLTGTAPTQSILKLPDQKLVDIHNGLVAKYREHLFFVDALVYDLIALGAETTYFREIFNTYPYFDFYSAEVGAGKTTGLKCLIWACYYGLLMLSPTLAVLFRTVDDTHGSIGVDELDKLFQNAKQNLDILNLLDSGHTKGIPAYRMNMDKTPPEPVAYDPFGLKAWTRTHWIPVELVSRAIRVMMIENKGFQVIKPPPIEADFQPFRDSLYVYRLLHHNDVAAVYRDLQTKPLLDGRVRDLYLPFLTLARLVSPDLYDRILKRAKEEEEARSIVKRDDRVVGLVECLVETNTTGIVPVVNIRDELDVRLRKVGLLGEKKLTSQQLIGWLEALGFSKSPKHTGGYAHYDIQTEQLDRLKIIYLSPYPDNLTNLTKPHSQSRTEVRLSEVSEVPGGSKGQGQSHAKESLDDYSWAVRVLRGTKSPFTWNDAVQNVGIVLGDSAKAIRLLTQLKTEGLCAVDPDGNVRLTK